MTTFLRELRYARRRLWRRRVATITAILTVGLVTGAGTSVTAFVNATMIRPLPYPDGERLAILFTLSADARSVADRLPLRSLDILRFRERLRQADAVEAAWAEDRIVGIDGADAVSVPAARVSPGFLTLFGGQPLLGQLWSVEDDLSQARVCAISHDLWLRRFGGDRGVVGRVVRIDRESYRIVAVMPPAFRPSSVTSDVWTPLVLRMESLPNPRSAFIQGFARLATGATVATLDAEVKAVLRDLERESPSTHAGESGGALPLRIAEYGDQRTAALVLSLGVVCLGLIALVNLANIRLARAIGERGDTTLRLALGASRSALLHAEVAEGAIVAVAAGTLGLGLAAAALPYLRAIDPLTTRAIGEVPIDWRMVLGSWGLATTVTLVAGLLPIWREARRHLTGGLVASSRRTSSGRRESRTRRVLVAAEAGLALLLLVSGAVFAAAVTRVAHESVGCDPSRLLVGQLRMPATAYPDVGARGEFARSVLERVRAVPGVANASTTLNPFVPRGGSYVTAITIEGRPRADNLEHTTQFRRESDGYFDTMRIPIVRGRAIGPEDRRDSLPVVVVSESFARKFWPGEDPLGRRLVRVGTAFTVVGIAGDINDTGPGAASSASLFYIPFAQNSASLSGATLVVRTDADPEIIAPAIRAAVLSVDRDQPLEKITTLTAFLRASLGPDRLRGTLLGLLAVLGLTLAGVGIFGVTACFVEERAPEMSLRVALGSSPGALSRAVVTDAVLTVAAGCAAGAIIAAVAGAALRRVLPDLTTGAPPSLSDAWAAAPALAMLTVAALIAAAIPARRASRADPRSLLR